MMQRFVLGLAMALSACSAEDPAPPTPFARHECGEHEIALPDGSCNRPGIAPDACGQGFTHDGEYACNPVLPPEPCAPGLMAVPGDAACRPVMPCGAGTWGDIPIDGATVYVDATYTGAATGSVDAPWPTIGDALAAAGADALVAIAAGIYVEDVGIWNRPVRLWGVCPEKVEVVGTGQALGAVVIGTGAHGSEVHGLAIRGSSNGLVLSGSESVVVDRVWVHDTAGRGIDVSTGLGAASIDIAGSLVETVAELGINLSGARATIESTAVRGTRVPSGIAAVGLNIQLACTATSCDPTAPSIATVRGALLERNEGDGIVVMGAEAVIESSVVRDTLPAPATPDSGRGARLQPACKNGVCDSSARANVTLRTSLFEHNTFAGVLVAGSSATVDSVVVRQTWPRAGDSLAGYGLYARLSCTDTGCDPASRSKLDVRASTIVDNHDQAILVMASDATIESTVVRNTQPSAADQWGGRGVVFQDCGGEVGCTGVRSNGTLRASLIEHSHEVGVALLGSDAIIEATAVRDTLPTVATQSHGNALGVGLSCTDTCDPNTRSFAQVRNAIFERSHSAGIAVHDSDATLDNSWVLDTKARPDGLFGDGVMASSQGTLVTIVATGMRVERSARAGVSAFGGSVSLSDTAIVCYAFALNGSASAGRAFDIQDRGGNTCGCPLADDTCKLTSEALTPPDPLHHP